jgi:hypothetical protein
MLRELHRRLAAFRQKMGGTSLTPKSPRTIGIPEKLEPERAEGTHLGCDLRRTSLGGGQATRVKMTGPSYGHGRGLKRNASSFVRR